MAAGDPEVRTTTAVSTAPAELAPLLALWLPAQRWFAGKGRPFTVSTVTALGLLTERPWRSDVWLVAVRYGDDGSTETYQVPLVRRPEPADQVSHVLVGDTPDPDYGGRSWWYDALHDKEVTGAWLTGIVAGRRDGALSFVPGPRAAGLPLDATSLVNTGEQSNTSLIFDDAAILKVFRRVYAGFNPDIEVHQALGSLGDGDRHVASLLGHVTGDLPTGEHADLAMLQEFFRTAADGWELAKISVRDLYAEADLHADEVGGDFAGEAHRLGTATAEVHADLARALPTGLLQPADLAGLAGAMARRLDAALPVVPELEAYAPGAAGGLRSAGHPPGPGARAAGARRLPPRPGAAHLAPLGGVGLRGRAGQAAVRADRAGLAGAGPGRDAALVRLRRPAPARRPPVRAAPGLPGRRVGAAQPGRLPGRVRGVRRAGPAGGRGAAARVRGRQGGVRGRIRGP